MIRIGMPWMPIPIRERPDPDTRQLSYRLILRQLVIVTHLELVEPELVRVFLKQEGEQLLVQWLVGVELPLGHVPGGSVSRHDVVLEHLQGDKYWKQKNHNISNRGKKYKGRSRGVPRILLGGMHIFGWPTPSSPPDLDPDLHQDLSWIRIRLT